jgi:hypothetical protein
VSADNDNAPAGALEITIAPPAAPGASSTVRVATSGRLLFELPPNMAGVMGATLIQLGAVALERDRVGTVVDAGPPPKPLIIV